ncbi:MAG: hypothetical protein OHK0040_03020 [bacterium]
MKTDLAIVTSTFDNVYSGVGTYAKLLVNGLKEAGLSFCVISPDCQHNPPYFIRTKVNSYDPSPNKWVSNSLAFGKVLSSIKDQIKMVHFLDAREAFLVRKERGITFIGSVHDTYSFDLQSQSLLKEHFVDWRKRLLYYTVLYKAEKRCYKKFDYFIANTDFVKERLWDFYDVERSIAETVYIGAPLKKIANERELKEPYQVSFIGGNFQRKGLIPLARAVKMLSDGGIKIRLLVAGRDKNELQIKARLKEMGCDDVVHFYGYMPPQNIPSFLMSSHLFAMPSYVEAFGLVYLEAMACGVPVVGTINGGTKELIKDGENGFLCDPLRTDDIADKIRKLLNPATRKRIIEKGYETVDKYPIDNSISGTIKIYEKLKAC